MKAFIITADEHDIRLDRWVARHLPHVSHGLLEKGIRKGWVKLNKKKTSASTRLCAGQSLEFADYLMTLQEDALPPRKEAISKISDADRRMLKQAVIYEDDDLLVLNKPAGLAVQGGSKQTKSVDSLLRARAGDVQVPKLVHRLDKDTSGVLILAKTSSVAAELSRLFAGKTIEKEYIALVIGLPKPEHGKIDMPLAKAIRGKHSGMEKVDIDFDDGKNAVTEYEVISTAGRKYSWVRLRPITGRTHQLRVHMASINHPIVGDGKYGGAEAFIRGGGIDEQLHLHAAKITISRRGKKTMTFEAPLPPHIQKSQDLIG